LYYDANSIGMRSGKILTKERPGKPLRVRKATPQEMPEGTSLCRVEDLCWVLDEERLCEPVTGVKW